MPNMLIKSQSLNLCLAIMSRSLINLSACRTAFNEMEPFPLCIDFALSLRHQIANPNNVYIKPMTVFTEINAFDW